MKPNELLAELDAELAALAPKLLTVEARLQAINHGVRARYNSRISRSWSDLLRIRVGTEIANKCDAFVAEFLPAAGSGLYVGYPRNEGSTP